MLLVWLIVIAAIPAAGLALLSLIASRWGRKHDAMGGRPGHVWAPDRYRGDDREE